MADRNGYIGRAPSDSSVTVARQTFSPTGVQTNFTFASGYTPGYLDAYLNGVKLVVAQDFTATDGSVVGLTTAAASGDILELVAFKAFNATTVSNAGTLSVSGNQTNDGTLSVTGGTTLSNLNVSGITTLGAGTFSTGLIDLKNDGSQSAIRLYCESSNAHYAALQAPAHSAFSGNITLTLPATTDTLVARTTTDTLTNKTLTSPTITTPTVTGDASFSGNVSIGGTLTYEDVTNIDSVGVVTARQGIVVVGGGITAVGVVTATSFVGDGSSLTGIDATQIVTGNTSVQTVDTGSDGHVKINTEGSERVRITSAGLVGINTASPGATLEVASTGTCSLNLVADSDNDGAANDSFIAFHEDSNSGTQKAAIKYDASQTNFGIETNGSRALSIDSSQRLLLGTTSARANTFNASAAPQVQVEGTNANLASIGIFCSASDVDGGRLLLAHQRSGGVGGNTIVNDDDQTGSITFQGSDGTQFVESASIKAEIDGTPGADDMPGRLIFSTTADGAASPTERLRITSAGRMGVGTNDPSTNLHVVGGIRATTAFDLRDTSGNIVLFVEDASNDARISNQTAGEDIIIRTTPSGGSATERLRISSDGFIGVNDSSPGRAIDVLFDDATAYDETALAPALGAIRIFNDSTTSNSTAGEIVFGSGDSGTAYATIGAKRVGSQETELVFRTSDSATLNEALRINKHGYVQVQANGDGDVRFQFNGNGTRIENTTSGGHMDFYTNSAVRIRNLYNGQGTEFANQTKVYPGTDNATDLGTSGGRYDDVFATNGTIQTSDSRLKREVETSVLGIDFVKALRPVSYKWIEGKKVPIVDGTDENGDNIYRTDADGNWVYESRDGVRRHWGFIAQEVKQAVDDASVDFAGWSLADKDDPDSTQSLRYEEFISPLTKALQEAIAKIETLETQNTAQQTQIDDLIARVTALEA